MQQDSLRILFLGGTGFIGPHMVRRAVAAGHEVSLFNRGRTNTDLFPEVERLNGDRNGQLDALRGHEWDVVIDNTGYLPRWVRDTAELLRGSVGRYVYTSTIDAYRDYHTPNMTEYYPLAKLPEPSEDTSRYYGQLNAEGERVVRELYPDAFTVVRPGWIVGPGDNNHLFTYWVVRVDRGGEVLAPGTPDDPYQVIDVRDLADWVIGMVERDQGGNYHAVGPTSTMGETLYGIRAVTSSAVSFTWVDADFLWEHGVRPYIDMPIWWPPRNDYAEPSVGGIGGGVGALNLDGSRARRNGLTHRPLAETARDTLDWYQATYNGWPEANRPGLTAGREAELLRAWHSR